MAVLDETITTLGDFVSATKEESPDLQLYIQLAEESSLITVTEVMKVLPKTKHDKPYLILRCR